MKINVLEYLDEAAAAAPGKTAFSDGADGLTFAQLYGAARSIGTFLAKRGLSREPVVVFMPKSPQTVAALFGVVCGGCYYVPLDDETPRLRVEMIFEKLKPRAAICVRETRDMIKSLGGGCAVYDYERAAHTKPDGELLEWIRGGALDTDPVYTVFTSGSTGVPKGVVANHRSVIDYTEALSGALGFDGETVFGNQAPLYVDACLKELYPTLKYRAVTYLIPKKLFMFPIKLTEYLNEHKINTICWVPGALTMISGLGALEKKPPLHLRTVAFGGEVFPMRQLNMWRACLPETRFFNLYGPTEATGMSCCFEVTRDFAHDEALPVGKPFRNTAVLLLDGDRPVTAPGETGEICIRGASLTMGYWGDPERTGAAFTQNPLTSAYPELIYRTGDIGRYNERGELMFVSRRDGQIKHMGHRIEPGEIETAAMRLDGVTAACCVYDEAHRKIVLYYAAPEELKLSALASHLRACLPGYMIPHAMTRLDAMPRTPNGKLDRALLKSGLNNDHRTEDAVNGRTAGDTARVAT
ncbi:MAG: amino acid adenylation domain-containing protein [Oscillospiraceae bacterium]|nr:amino acid adenylation domain-containing protein [Oscillospiraceae bacterium]